MSLRVRCVSNQASTLSDMFLESLGVDRAYRFQVAVGEEYVVYALLIDGGRIFYYLCADAGNTFPIWFPSPLFENADSRVSSQWVFRGYSASPPRDVFAIFAFRSGRMTQRSMIGYPMRMKPLC